MLKTNFSNLFLAIFNTGIQFVQQKYVVKTIQKIELKFYFYKTVLLFF